LGGSNASVTVRLGSELHKPVVVKVYRLSDIWFPQMGFVGIDWHCITFLATFL
jgi:hypothetical protein